jgi:DNA-binding NarL/FixJ family response regulator
MVPDVLVIEDDDFTRMMLVASLSSIGLGPIYSSATAAGALQLAHKHMPSVALIDLHLGDGPTGLDVARQLRAHNSQIELVILTSYEDPRLLGENIEFIPAGVRYLMKKDISDVSVLADALIASPRANLSGSGAHPGVVGRTLSSNQLAILKLVAEGHSNLEIAKRQGVTEKAIEGTITRLSAKLSLEPQPSINQRVHIARVYFRALGLDIGNDHSIS